MLLRRNVGMVCYFVEMLECYVTSQKWLSSLHINIKGRAPPITIVIFILWFVVERVVKLTTFVLWVCRNGKTNICIFLKIAIAQLIGALVSIAVH